MDMFNEFFLFNNEWKNQSGVIEIVHRLTSFPVSGDMNQYRQYTANWPIALKALRQLWEVGKVSELKSPFYERVEKRTNR